MSNAPANLDEYIELCEERQIEMDNRVGMYLTVVQYDRANAKSNLQKLINWINAHPEADDCAMIDYVQENFIP